MYGFGFGKIIQCRLKRNILLRFSQTCEFWSSKANWRLHFSLPYIILTDLLGNKTLLYGFKRSRLVDFDLFCVFLCFQVRCLWSYFVIDGSEKRNCEGGFWTLEFACLWKFTDMLQSMGLSVHWNTMWVSCVFNVVLVAVLFHNRGEKEHFQKVSLY